MNKKKDPKPRHVWKINPKTRVVDSKKMYSRKKRTEKDYTLGDVYDKT